MFVARMFFSKPRITSLAYSGLLDSAGSCSLGSYSFSILALAFFLSLSFMYFAVHSSWATANKSTVTNFTILLKPNGFYLGHISS